MKLNSPFGLRLWSLVIALVLVTGGTIYALSSAWHRIDQLTASLTSSRFETFRLADQFQRELLQLNDSVLRYTLTRQPGQWEHFEEASRDLDRWIDAHDPSINPKSPLTTDDEREGFKRLNVLYDQYLAAAAFVHTNKQPPLISSGEFTQLEQFNKQAARMHDLGNDLADAHRKAETMLLSAADTSLAHVQTFLTFSVILLLILIAALGLVTYRDLVAPLRTRLVQSENLLQRQEKLATLGTLAAGIAHEIRNPLTSLKARLYTLEKQIKNVPAARRDTEIIGAEISRLERIVQEVLSFARPVHPKPENLSVEVLLREVQGLMAPSLESRGVTLALEPGPALRIRGDSAQLKQVLVNLVRNGAEAINGEGTVRLHARAARAALRGNYTDVVILEVSDTGAGISPEAERRLFDPFFSTKETGTGLGLPIAARIVETLGGQLQYQTRPGHGTTFGIILPQEQEVPAADPLGITEPAAGPPREQHTQATPLGEKAPQESRH